MGVMSTLATRGPYHILGFGLLFGSSIFQSFINGIISFKTLPKAQFSQLQQRLFPIYFALQVFFSLSTLFTLPASIAPSFHLLSSFPFFSTSYNLFSTLPSDIATTTLLSSAISGMFNLWYIGPKTTEIMRIRKRQETIDGRNYDGKKIGSSKDNNAGDGNGPISVASSGRMRGGEKEKEDILVSTEMADLNKQFGIWHGVSSLVNLGGIIGTMIYGVVLAELVR